MEPPRYIAALLLVIASLPAWAAEPQRSPLEAAWNVMEKSLQDSSTDHRRQALAALASIEGTDQRAVNLAIAALSDKDVFVRETAALALGQMHAAAAVPSLKKALDDSGEVAFAAARALTEIGDPSGREVLVAVLAGDRTDIGPGPVTALVRKGTAQLHDPKKLLFMGVKGAAGATLGPASMALPAAAELVELGGKDAEGRAAAAAYLARDPEDYAISLLEWALADKNEFVRLESARGLGQRGNAGSVKYLHAALEDEHNIVRAFAAAGIIRISDRGGEPGEPEDGPVPAVTNKKTKTPAP
jgi:HEAT repeat protein